MARHGNSALEFKTYHAMEAATLERYIEMPCLLSCEADAAIAKSLSPSGILKEDIRTRSATNY
jgi:hypothetical protein